MHADAAEQLPGLHNCLHCSTPKNCCQPDKQNPCPDSSLGSLRPCRKGRDFRHQVTNGHPRPGRRHLARRLDVCPSALPGTLGQIRVLRASCDSSGGFGYVARIIAVMTFRCAKDLTHDPFSKMSKVVACCSNVRSLRRQNSVPLHALLPLGRRARRSFAVPGRPPVLAHATGDKAWWKL